MRRTGNNRTFAPTIHPTIISHRMRYRRILPLILIGALGAECGNPTDASDPGEIPVLKALSTVVVDSSGIALPADGVSSRTVTTTIYVEAVAAHTTLTMSTSVGSLIGDSGTPAASVIASVSKDGIARATLVAPTSPGTALVNAKLGREIATTTLTIMRAYPDTLFLDLPRFTIAANLDSAITLRAHLVRRVGKPTAGAIVTFTATQGGAAIGVFSTPTTSDANGDATVRFAVPSGASGDVTITATTARATGTVSTNATLRINP